MPSDTETRGFMAGLLRTRRGLDYEEEMGNTPDRPSGPDPFLHGYRQGAKAREEMIAEAVERTIPQLSSRERLLKLVEEGEKLLSDIDQGSFDEEAFRVEVARALVHLADTEA